jgi:hypothetical protein
MTKSGLRPLRIVSALVLATVAGAMTPAPAAAQPLPSIADQPAATLLLPHFEVDLANPAGANTVFTINNAAATATIAHVTVWSTMHVPVYGFDVYLTGYDVQTLNVRNIINGVLPVTASAGQDPSDTISNQGPLSQDVNFASCTGLLPPPPVPQDTVDHIRAALTGRPSALAGGLCASIDDGTQIARGYITVDAASSCALLTPRDPGYFIAGGLGVANNQNVLWGDSLYTNHLGGLESGDSSPLVHIRADAVDPQTSVPGNYTFYGRLVAWTAIDNREPLSNVFAARFARGGAFTQTTLTVWRDAKVNQNYFNCNNRPSWYPLAQEQIAFFDEQERPEFTANIPFAPQPPFDLQAPFPLATQRVTVGSAALPTAHTFGWVYLDLATIVTGSINPPEDPTMAQAWVSVHMKGSGRYSVGWPAVMLDSAKASLSRFIGF